LARFCSTLSFLERPVIGKTYSTPWLAHLASDRRYAAMLGLGFSTGLPFLLVYSTQSAWLSEAGVSIRMIGLLSELTIAYKFKFLWSPFLEKYDPPFLAPLVGRRRGWIIISQIAVALALTGVAFGDPANFIAWTVAFSLALGFAGATQDVTIDGWRITAAPPDKQSLMTAFSEAGYRVGTLAAGAGTLIAADRYGWRAAYVGMAALMIIGTLSAILAPEPESDRIPRGDHADYLTTIIEPIRELMRRLGRWAIPVLLLIAGFRMPGYLSSAMSMPLFKSLHISDTDIATVTKLFGFWIAIAGTFLASFVVRAVGLIPSLLIGTVAGSASHLSLAWLAASGHGELLPFAVAVGIEGLAYAFAQVVLITYMSSLASTEFAASQYALLTSLCSLPGSLLAGASGFVIEQTGFASFFVGTALIGIPVALLALFVLRYHPPLSP
jgi:MFS transporter, PAT family, beta-lactamase induction signal transducer AmpG